jgi:hypothetical protein
MMCLWASYKKKYGKNIFFCILKTIEERSRIWSWIRIRIQLSEVRIRGSGSAPKCHGSPTVVIGTQCDSNTQTCKRLIFRVHHLQVASAIRVKAVKRLLPTY